MKESLSKVCFISASGKETADVLAEKAEKIFIQTNLEESIDPEDFVALKIHFGEKGNSGYIKPTWLTRIISRIKKKTSRAFFTDTNTLYIGSRSNTVNHMRLAAEHGFSLKDTGLPVVIGDGLIGQYDNEFPVNLPRIKEAKIAGAYFHTDALLCLSHLTGHMLTGVGAAIKNLGMGCASRAGKLEQHSDVHPWVNPKICENCGICFDYCPAGAILQGEGQVSIVDEKCIGCGECLVVCPEGAVKMRWDDDKLRVQEKMAEYAYSVSKLFREKAGYINFLIHITKDCDCMAKKGPVIAEDLGILGSVDPVALDKASVDLVLENSRSDVLKKANPVDWSRQLEHAQQIGLGSLEYELIEIFG